MTNKAVPRIKSAAFIRTNQEKDESSHVHPKPTTIIADLPISQSVLVVKHELSAKHAPTAKTLSPSRLALSRSSPSLIWRKVNSTRSQARLKSLSRWRAQQEPIRLNLLEKVQRIKEKHSQRQMAFLKEYHHTQRILSQRCCILHKKGDRNGLNRKIIELIAPLRQASILEEQRYRARLSRLSNH